MFWIGVAYGFYNEIGLGVVVTILAISMVLISKIVQKASEVEE